MGKGNKNKTTLTKAKFAMKCLPKAKAKVKPGSSKDSPGILKNKPLAKGKAKAKAKAKAKSLTKAQLDSLGAISLKDRIKKATEGAETAEEAVELLKDTLTPKEKQSAWSKMQTKIKNDPEEKKKVVNMTKKEVGLYATMCLLKDKAPTFMTAKQELNTAVSLTKGEDWCSELQMLQRFTKDEFDAHLASGRVTWRTDPWTPNCYQYQDQGDIKKSIRVDKSTSHAWGQEYQAEGGEEDWGKHFGKDLSTHLLGIEGKGKGKGKGKQEALTKGKGKGKANKRKLLALTDGKVEEEGEDQEGQEEEEEEKPTEAEEWSKCLAKARKARDLLVGSCSAVEEEMAKASSCQRLSKGAKKDAEALLLKAQTFEKKVKDLLLKEKKAMGLTKAKALVQEIVEFTKEVKEQKKELSLVANKALSKASSKK